MSHILSKHYLKIRLHNVKGKSTFANYQYITQSIIPTMHFQKSLPRLPIPKLEATCERYLAAQRPILSAEEFKKTESYVNQFMSKEGPKFQLMLKKQDRSNRHTSYISEPWFEMYLKNRDPIPINVNPMLVFQNDPKAEYNNQLIRSANLLISGLRFYKALEDNILEPEVFHMNPGKSDNERFRKICAKTPKLCSWYAAYLHNAYPLDMSQYKSLFNTTRVPNVGKDSIFSKKSKHILVQYKCHFYIFDVLNDEGQILPPQDILAGLRSVLSDQIAPSDHPLGVLTTMNRDDWAKQRSHIAQLGNDQVIELIDSALFNICLDDNELRDDKSKWVRNFLHGDGKNRWFDKSVSLIVTKDGFAGINFEHSMTDGVSVLRFFQDILKDSTENPQIHPDTSSNSTVKARRLEFNLDDVAKAAIKEAAVNYDKVCNALDINFIESDGLGKEFCKKHKISPDGVMQLCFQSAYFKQYGKSVTTYESCSTAAFKHGRTEAIRPNTVATAKFCSAINSTSHNQLSNSDLRNLIKECSSLHGQLTKEAAMGQGFDRHLFALRLIAEQMDSNSVDIFKDEAYQKMNYNILSTSTLSSPAVIAGGFGPVVKDGYGVGYVIRDRSMGTLVTSYPNLNGREFINCLTASIQEVIKILNM